jgi:hypothetical protein
LHLSPLRLTPAASAKLLLALAALLLSAQPPAARAQSGRQADAAKPAQKNAPPAPAAPPSLKRSTTRQETRRFAFGGRLTIYGAPLGSITVEAWTRNEVEVVAEIEQSADTEEELARLAAVNTFLLDEDMNHLSIVTVGTHDRKYMKRAARDFPKKLLPMPWKIDYRLRVPVQTDLEISAGGGPVTIRDVEGALHFNAGDVTPASLRLSGGDVESTLGSGTVNLDVSARSWRGRGLTLRLGRGDINLALPAGFSGYVNAQVIDVGRVVNEHPDLKPAERTTPNERSLRGQAGAGGATISLTLASGTIRITQAGK